MTIKTTKAAALVLAALAPLTACTKTASTSGTHSTPLGSGSQRLVLYPDAGFDSFRHQIADAKSSVWIEMYSLNDPSTEDALIAAKKRGVDVRVMLSSASFGNMKKANSHAYAHLSSGGVAVKWAPTGYIFHIKTSVFDGREADVSTANLNAKNYADTRDAMIVTSDAAQVKAISDTFAADWTLKGKPKEHTRNAPGLIWSPGATDAMISAIKQAETSIRFSSEELAYAPVVDALADDARRGVRCTVMMTRDKQYANAYATLRKAGCKVSLLADNAATIYVHEKVIITDDARATLGSQNASRTSLGRNRELSIQTTDHDIVSTLATTFDADATRGSSA